AKDVRAQTGKFGDKFWALAKVSSGDQIKKWKDALEFPKLILSRELLRKLKELELPLFAGGAQSHHCINVEIAHMNFSNARGEEEQNQEV
ncbi:hypothetical protein HID58_093145, partial [Brassica napus]